MLRAGRRAAGIPQLAPRRLEADLPHDGSRGFRPLGRSRFLWQGRLIMNSYRPFDIRIADRSRF